MLCLICVIIIVHVLSQVIIILELSMLADEYLWQRRLLFLLNLAIRWVFLVL